METKNPNQEIAEVFYRLNVGVPVEDDLLARAFGLILTNPHVKARDVQLGAFLTGMMVKEPTVKQIVILIRTALNIDGVTRYKPTLPDDKKLVAVPGSGKKGHKTFNISTPACLVASAAGAYVAKPGSAATSSISGSKDFITTVGAKLLEPNEMIEVLLATGFGIFPIEEFIPRFDAVYGGKTFGPTPLSFAFPAVANPIACDSLLYGLSHPNVNLSLRAFRELGYKNVIVVSSTSDKIHYIDELSSMAFNLLGKLQDGIIGDVEGFSPTTITKRVPVGHEELEPGASVVENVQSAVRVLQGKMSGPREDTVALNAAAILLLSGQAETLEVGFKTAIEVIKSGAGLKKLEQFIDATGGSRMALLT